MICLFFFFPSISLLVLLYFSIGGAFQTGICLFVYHFTVWLRQRHFFCFSLCLTHVWLFIPMTQQYLHTWLYSSVFCLLTFIVMYNVSASICSHLSDSLKGSFVFTWVTICLIQYRLSFIFYLLNPSPVIFLSLIHPLLQHIFFFPHSTTLFPSSILHTSFFFFFLSLFSSLSQGVVRNVIFVSLICVFFKME